MTNGWSVADGRRRVWPVCRFVGISYFCRHFADKNQPMKITCTLSRRIDGLGRSQVLMRLTLDHRRQWRLKSGVFVPRDCWREGRVQAPRGGRRRAAEAEAALTAVMSRIYNLCASTPPALLSADYLRARLGQKPLQALADYVEPFLRGRELSRSRCRQYRTLERMLRRYRGGAVTPAQLQVDDFAAWLRTEAPRGHNTVCSVLRRLRAVCGWLKRRGLCERSPFEAYTQSMTEVYGTPYFLNAAELNALAAARLDGRDAELRDVFVFQCLTGCRVSDLMRLTRANVADGMLRYIARKTGRTRPVELRVPLCDTALAILERHAADSRLLPFPPLHSYNAGIRRLLRRCGITRTVGVVDPVSGLERMVAVCDVAGSHLARRSFVGNLYRLARDPGIVGALSGHKEGSAAFARYRCIDDDIKRELVAQTFCRHDPAAAP